MSAPRRILRSLGRLLLLGVILVALAAVALVLALRGSLPRLDGSVPMPGLGAAVRVERDALGVPSIQASSRADVARTLGFLHAQDRFFQMDILRRRGAGELAALIGPALVDHDKAMRLHRLRDAAQRAVRELPAEHATLLDAYTAGVNAGLQNLRVRPPEYLLLRTTPEPWRPEDSVLVGFAMFATLQDSEGATEAAWAGIERALPPQARSFFFSPHSAWDAALDGTQLPAPLPPDPSVLDLRVPAGQASRSTASDPFTDPELVPGSNAWGVPGKRSASGAAIVANDMHLDLGIPNIWYRAVMRWPVGDGRERRLVGATLPGLPTLIVGSNGDVAWTFTNATIDTSDLVDLETEDSHPGAYRTPTGWRAFETVTESIAVHGDAPVTLTFRTTLWGPVPPSATNTPPRALCWIAHQPGAANLGLFDLEHATHLDQALALAPRIGAPVQNFLAGDRLGALGWTLIGKVPRRVGFEGTTPTSWADGTRRWEGWTDPSAYPVHRSQGGGFWTANNRISGTPEYLVLGVHQTDLGARAQQIRDDLNALPTPTRETDLLSIHRDDRALFLARWQKLLVEVTSRTHPRVAPARWTEFKAAVETWGGRASVDSAGYRLVRDFRHQTMERVTEPILARCARAAGAEADTLFSERLEDPVWTLITERPAHLLNPKYANYDALLEDAAEAALGRVAGTNQPVAAATWGARNTVRIRHPIARAVPALGRWLNLDPEPIHGDTHMPRVQGPAFGASERMVVSPGHEESGLFHMPGGQSGHFLSPFYRAGHRDWAEVRESPLLPGPAQHTLLLSP